MDNDDYQENNRPSFREALDTGLDKMMNEAWQEVKSDFSNGSTLDKVTSSAKWLGKGSFFVGIKAIQNIPAALERMKEEQAKKK
ncbi:hypothetical protein EQ826_20750 [Ectopseudomonas mendocina]|nr:hypothetical protein [Pseudomonas mendocina]TRO22597.1 hypothetical protein EQ826_20750 [Pseudomonas mendocina]